MPAHEIEMQVPAQSIKNADAVITVWADGETHGKLKISRGSVDWTPGRAVKRSYRMSWEKFDEVMKTYGKELG